MRKPSLLPAFLIIISILMILNVQASIEPRNDTIKIGFLIEDNNFLSAKDGAELALMKANQKKVNSPVKMIVRSMEGPWGTGSKEAVNLIFKENVCAILGSHGGRNAHLVEQVAAKSRIVFVSAWASDPTLSQAFVPWFFNCVPNDVQQASALISEVYVKRKIDRVVVISDNGYDSRLALKTFVKRSATEKKPEPIQLEYDNSNRDFSKLIDQINTANANGIILFGQPPASLKLINDLRQRKMNQLVFGSLSLSGGRELTDQELKNCENVIMISPEYYFNKKGQDFISEFQKIYGYRPGPAAAYAFDSMSLIIEAVRKAGTDYQNIQKALTGIKYDGVTGAFGFDDKGNRLGNINLMEIANGHLTAQKK
jgi:branched-chain amino acid transport system substrate-binding protein